jgi:hypothetical protein
MGNTQVARPWADAVCLRKSWHTIRAGGSDSSNRMFQRSSLAGRAYPLPWMLFQLAERDLRAFARTSGQARASWILFPALRWSAPLFARYRKVVQTIELTADDERATP